MRKLVKNTRGQFIIIAMMLIAIMIISIGATMHRAITYYKHEPWEEYSTLIGDVELNSRRLVELSLANYTKNDNPGILTQNLPSYKSDLLKVYPSKGIIVESNTASGQESYLGLSITFNQGVAKVWNGQDSYSAAKANFSITIQSIGLSGYSFTEVTILRLKIIAANSTGIYVTLKNENNLPVNDLTLNNFKANGLNLTSASPFYDKTNGLTYQLKFEGILPAPLILTAWDSRGIMVVSNL
jgi:hypothetical protein